MLFALALAFQTPKSPALLEVPVHHRRPSFIADQIRSDGKNPSALIPPSIIGMSPDDAAGKIVLRGSRPEDLQNLSQVIALFDVEPKHLTTEVSIESPVDHYQTKSSIESVNQEAWTMNSSYTHLQIEGTCRINADGTITVQSKVTTPTGSISAVWRERNDQPVQLILDKQTNKIVFHPFDSKTTTKSIDVKGKFIDHITIVMKPKIS